MALESRTNTRTVVTVGALALGLVAMGAWLASRQDGATTQPRATNHPMLADDEGPRGDDGPTTGKHPVPGATLDRSFSWSDEDGTYEVWLDPTVVVQLHATESADETRRRLPAATELAREAPAVRVWTLSTGAPRADQDAFANLPTTNGVPREAGVFLPAYRSRAHTNSPLRLFSNRLLVKMDPSWDRVAVRDWAAQFGLTVVRSQSYEPSTYVMRVASDDVALIRAQDLRNRRGVLSVGPDRLFGLDVR